MIYVGTASKTLAPGLRLGWLSVPGSLSEPFALAKDPLDRGTSALEQRTFAEFIAGGAFGRSPVPDHCHQPVPRRETDTPPTVLDPTPDLTSPASG